MGDGTWHELERHEAIAQLRLEELERWARGKNGNDSLTLRDWIELAGAWRIIQALRETRGNRSAAARSLGIGRRTLYTKMQKFGLAPTWVATRRPGPAAPAARTASAGPNGSSARTAVRNGGANR